MSRCKNGEHPLICKVYVYTSGRGPTREKEAPVTVTIDNPTRRFVSIGRVAELVGLSPSRLRELEAAGVLPKAARLEGTDRRLYAVPEDLEAIRAALADRATGQQARGAA